MDCNEADFRNVHTIKRILKDKEREYFLMFDIKNNLFSLFDAQTLLFSEETNKFGTPQSNYSISDLYTHNFDTIYILTTDNRLILTDKSFEIKEEIITDSLYEAYYAGYTLL